MKVKEYLKRIGIENPNKCYMELCFVIGTVVGEGHSKQFMYRHTPLRTISEWFGNDGSTVLDYIVINTKQPVTYWLSGANWNPAIESNRIMSLLVISKEELHKYYSKEQAESTIAYIDTKIVEDIWNGLNPIECKIRHEYAQNIKK